MDWRQDPVARVSEPPLERKLLHRDGSNFKHGCHFRRRTTAFTCRAGCNEREVSKNRHAGPVKCNALLAAAVALVFRHDSACRRMLQYDVSVKRDHVLLRRLELLIVSRPSA